MTAAGRRLSDLVARVAIGRFPLALRLFVLEDAALERDILVIRYRAPHRDRGDETQVARELFVPTWIGDAPDEKIVSWVHHELVKLVVHEFDEHFTFDRRRIYDPHSVDPT